MPPRKFFSIFFIFLLSGTLLTSCSRGSTQLQIEPKNSYYQFVDDLGNTVFLEKKPERIISTYGSYAETWLLSGGTLVGVTDDVLSERKLDISPMPIIIGKVKTPNIESILALKPDFVLLSANIPAQIALSDTLTKAGIAHAYFRVEHFKDYLCMLNILTDITGRKDLYQKNGVDVEQRIQAILKNFKPKVANPSVLAVRCFSSNAKPLAADTMVNVMLKELGADNVITHTPSLLSDLSLEKILEEDPSYILAVPMGNVDQAQKEMKQNFETNPSWKDLAAVKENHYIFLPKELFHYKPNAHWDESYAYLANLLS
ncbi:ABC transporter substrate-binding protein [uncultured Sphaerochaeta sp.]|uniref:ABC transporter substrate-binding protein n=1 Tax=uncultured Sphaerochaeta sp. TaxID=886478 RepID=UPI002A0A1901|nr:ABC transporter substrate-binding protein [uncultured Sphaerochaeta sp.]